MIARPQTEKRVRHTLETWSGESLATALVQTEGAWGGVWSLYGMGEEQVLGLMPQMRQALDAKGLYLMALDPTGTLIGTRTFSDALGSLVQEVERRGLVNVQIEERLEWLHSVQSGTLSMVQEGIDVTSRDVMARLWCALCEVLPTVLVVFYPARCGPQLAGCLDYLARYFYNDPIASLSPDLQRSHGVRGGILSVSVRAQAPAFLEEEDVRWEMLDASKYVEQSLREYLARPEVLEKLIVSTRGDMERLGELVEHLDGQVNYLWLRRVRALSAEVRGLVECVALASEPVEMSWVSHAMATRGFGPLSQGLLKKATTQGLISRVIEMGAVRLRLAHPEWAEAIAEMLDEQICQQWHRALYQAALSQGVQVTSARFVTVHALEAGDLGVAKDHGNAAVRALMKEGQNEEAAKLIEHVLERLEYGEVEALELHTLAVEAWVRQGRWALGLRHCEALEPLVVGESGRIEWAVRTASVLLEMDRFEEVIVLLEQVIAELDASHGAYDVRRGRLLVELGDARYRLGNYRRGRELGEEALLLLERATSPEKSIVRYRLRAEHLIGCCAIMEADYEKAEAIFVKNRRIAEENFWEDMSAKFRANVGISRMMKNEYESALEDLLGALEVAQRTPSMSTSSILVNIAYLYHFRYDYEQAMRYYLDTLRAAKQRHEGRLYNITFYNMLSLYRDIGAYEKTREMLARFFDDQVPCGRNFIHSRAKTQQMLLAHDVYDAQAVFELSKGLDQSHPHQDLTAAHTQRLLYAWSLLELGQTDAAHTALEPLEQERPNGDLFVQGFFHYLKASLAFKNEDWEGTAKELKLSEGFAQQEHHFHMIMKCALLQSKLCLVQGEEDQAKKTCQNFVSQIHEHGAAHVPQAWRSHFYDAPLFGRMTQHASSMGVEIPESLRQHLLSAPGGDKALSGTVESNDSLRQWRARFGEIVGESKRLYHLFRMVEKVAKGDTTVLLLGESGTGKELFAHAIHEHSARGQQALCEGQLCGVCREPAAWGTLWPRERRVHRGHGSKGRAL